MPLAIQNTTLADAYTQATTFAGTDVFAWGFFTVANNPAFVQLFQGEFGQADLQPEVYCPPATYPIAGGARKISGIRARNAVAGQNVQFFGSMFYPNEPGIQAGTPFTGIVAPSGSLSGALGLYDLITSPVDITSSAAESNLWSKSLPAADFANGQTALECSFYGDFLYNRNIGDTLTWRVRLGPTAPGTLIWSPGTEGFSATLSANRGGWAISFLLTQPGSLVSQNIEGIHIVEAGTGRGLGTAGGSSYQPTQAAATKTDIGYIFGSAAENWTSDLLIQLTAQWSVASALNSCRVLGGVINRLSL
jgi:hypothetical protein